eukprot:g14417.t1
MDLHASKKRKSWGVRGLVASLTTLQLLQFPGCTALASANVTASTPYVDTPNPAEADRSRDEALQIGTQIVQALASAKVEDIKPTIDLCAEHGTLVRKGLPLDAQLHLASWLFIHGTAPNSRAGNNAAACFRNLAPTLPLSHMGADINAFTKSQMLITTEDAKMYEAYFGLPATFVLYERVHETDVSADMSQYLSTIPGAGAGDPNAASSSAVQEGKPKGKKGKKGSSKKGGDVAPQAHQEGPLSVMVPPGLGESRWHQIYASGTAFDVYPRALSKKSHWREWEGEVEGERVPECEWVFPVDEDGESVGGGNLYRKEEL